MVEFDAAVRKGNSHTHATGNKLLGEVFLHRCGIPFSEVPIDYVTAAGWAAMRQELANGEADLEWLQQEVIDGSSPWARRGELARAQDDFGLAS
ncbi:hypothetical protein [Streptomyces sp. NPDC102462]|uniref:hypothetical protein n=1 Tax=Streptomyces sp. NPDC102462 TaxID=3366178 RepID=UPI003816AE6E